METLNIIPEELKDDAEKINENPKKYFCIEALKLYKGSENQMEKIEALRLLADLQGRDFE